MARTDHYAMVRDTPEYRAWLAEKVERRAREIVARGTPREARRYTFGTREDGSPKVPVSDGTNHTTFVPFVTATAPGGRPRYHERNYSTGARPKRKRRTDTWHAPDTEKATGPRVDHRYH